MNIIKQLKIALQTSIVAGVLAFSVSANAASQLGVEPPSSLIVNAGGLEWVWAGPCAPVSPSCGVVQLHNDFRLPTAQEWLSSFASLSVINSAFRPNGGQLCSSPYFNVVYNHCDSGDLNIGAIWHLPAFFGGQYTESGAAEAFLVRGAQQVPEPATLALLSMALIGAGAARRRKNK